MLIMDYFEWVVFAAVLSTCWRLVYLVIIITFYKQYKRKTNGRKERYIERNKEEEEKEWNKYANKQLDREKKNYGI